MIAAVPGELYFEDVGNFLMKMLKLTKRSEQEMKVLKQNRTRRKRNQSESEIEEALLIGEFAFMELKGLKKF